MLTLTTTEAAALTGLDERTVRKDVEHGILEVGSPPRFSDVALVYFRACASFTFRLTAHDRRKLYQDIAAAIEHRLSRLELGYGWTLDIAGIVAELHARVSLFEAWRSTLVTADDILGGEPVFPNSRLSVRHVGEMLLRGAGVVEVQEDYPFLTERDIEFARLYATAYPRIGRPRAKVAA